MQKTITLKDFYRAIQAWVDAGCSEDNNPYGFVQDWGICSNLDAYTFSMGYNTLSNTLEDELKASLKECFTDHVYPFNTKPGSYNAEHNKYTNPERLQWIKSHLK